MNIFIASLLLCAILPAFAQSPAELVAALKTSTPATRPAIEAQLVTAGPEAALPALLPEMRRRRLIVLDVVRKLGEGAVPTLLALLKDPAVGGSAREALFEAAKDGSGNHVADFLACMKDAELAGACGTALVRVSGPKAQAQVPDIAAALKVKGDSRLYAAAALERIGPKAARAVPGLIEALKDKEPAARWSAAKALGAIGRGAQAAIPALKAAAKTDENADVRRFAAKALKKIPAVTVAAKKAGSVKR